MSHGRERNEANCLNCDTEVIGRYCHVCGQENIEPRESFLGLVKHFIYDFTHFDGKFFDTLGALITKPGFLPAEFMRGRRARYLNPIRMYLFTSAIFFFIFYSYSGNALWSIGSANVNLPAEAGISATGDTTGFPFTNYSSIEAYDSAQSLLPEHLRDNRLERHLSERFIRIKTKYGGRIDLFSNAVLDKLIHSYPTLLFVSLPLLALVLKLLYRRRNFIYADHAIYLLYLFIFVFILVLGLILFDKLAKLTSARWPIYINYFLFLFGLVYYIFSYKIFYGQRWGKTVLKFAIFNILTSIIIIILFVIFLLFTFFRV